MSSQDLTESNISASVEEASVSNQHPSPPSDIPIITLSTNASSAIRSARIKVEAYSKNESQKNMEEPVLVQYRILQSADQEDTRVHLHNHRREVQKVLMFKITSPRFRHWKFK
jgi:hypothetical protein